MKNEFHISEIFLSIEGEGKRTGYMSVFVRFTGCNLRCSYCDTKYALHMGEDDSEVLTEDELIDRIKSLNCKKVTLTGGEPLLHDIETLVQRLAFMGYEINIETNGTVPLINIDAPLLDERYFTIFYTMDWKCPSSCENHRMLKENLKKLTKYDVLKFVVGCQQDLDEMKQIVSEFTGEHPQFYVSPVFGEIEPKDIVEYLKDNQLFQVCTQVQLHKIIWNPNERGV